MIESYRVGVVLELRDEASPAIRALYENASRLEKMFGDVAKAISGINRVALGDFTAKLGGISEKLTGNQDQCRRAWCCGHSLAAKHRYSLHRERSRYHGIR